ncbi:hypothetical protein F8388_020385 [Cannabis sativa]|uniref:Uncharacterized protein n=1 Tax=Cannabis sativa TaxID=3483 RepID=A0A7J6HJC6_CANSA|nr:hypothetical protein F8388_020385 [Cannabis sativa]
MSSNKLWISVFWWITWLNKRHGGAQVQERLDRYFCNQGRHDLFPSVKVINVDLFHSDHRPIVATLENIIRLRSNDKKRSFRFKTHWLKDATCHEIVNKTWLSPDFPLASQDKTQKQLDDLLSVSAPLVRMDEVKRLEVKLKDLFSREECYWKLPVESGISNIEARITPTECSVMVSDLIGVDESWDIHTLSQYFLRLDINVILVGSAGLGQGQTRRGDERLAEDGGPACVG